jgi:hypothetical protein
MWNREYSLLLIVLLTGGWLVHRMHSGYQKSLPENESFVRLQIYQQPDTISNLYAAREVLEPTKTLRVNSVDFLEKHQLVHRDLGYLGVSGSFFIDLYAECSVSKSGLFSFSVSSDDGFALVIDDQIVMEFPGDRPYAETRGEFYLKKGTHSIVIHYFQGGGPMGLKASYQLSGATDVYLIGESSDVMIFKPVSPEPLLTEVLAEPEGSE